MVVTLKNILDWGNKYFWYLPITFYDVLDHFLFNSIFVDFIWFFFFFFFQFCCFNGVISCLRQILATESPSEMMKNVFFHLKFFRFPRYFYFSSEFLVFRKISDKISQDKFQNLWRHKMENKLQYTY